MVATPPDPQVQAIVRGVETYNEAQSLASKIATNAIEASRRQREFDAQLANRTQTQQPR